jgi:hypothetical protein
MPKSAPWTHSQKEIESLFIGITQGPGRRADKVARFVKAACAIPMEGKPTKTQLEGLYKNLETRHPEAVEDALKRIEPASESGPIASRGLPPDLSYWTARRLHKDLMIADARAREDVRTEYVRRGFSEVEEEKLSHSNPAWIPAYLSERLAIREQEVYRRYGFPLDLECDPR